MGVELLTSNDAYNGSTIGIMSTSFTPSDNEHIGILIAVQYKSSSNDLVNTITYDGNDISSYQIYQHEAGTGIKQYFYYLHSDFFTITPSASIVVSSSLSSSVDCFLSVIQLNNAVNYIDSIDDRNGTDDGGSVTNSSSCEDSISINYAINSNDSFGQTFDDGQTTLKTDDNYNFYIAIGYQSKDVSTSYTSGITWGSASYENILCVLVVQQYVNLTIRRVA